jgi:hypothetical protein
VLTGHYLARYVKMREAEKRGRRGDSEPGASLYIIDRQGLTASEPAFLCPSGGAEVQRVGLSSDQSKLTSDFSEGREGLVQVITGMSGGDLTADPCLSLRHYREAEAGDKHTLL